VARRRDGEGGAAAWLDQSVSARSIKIRAARGGVAPGAGVLAAGVVEARAAVGAVVPVGGGRGGGRGGGGGRLGEGERQLGPGVRQRAQRGVHGGAAGDTARIRRRTVRRKNPAPRKQGLRAPCRGVVRGDGGGALGHSRGLARGWERTDSGLLYDPARRLALRRDRARGELRTDLLGGRVRRPPPHDEPAR